MALPIIRTAFPLIVASIAFAQPPAPQTTPKGDSLAPGHGTALQAAQKKVKQPGTATAKKLHAADRAGAGLIRKILGMHRAVVDDFRAVRLSDRLAVMPRMEQHDARPADNNGKHRNHNHQWKFSVHESFSGSRSPAVFLIVFVPELRGPQPEASSSPPYSPRPPFQGRPRR